MMIESDKDFIEKASNEYEKIANGDIIRRLQLWAAENEYNRRLRGKTADVTIIDEGIGGKEDMPVNRTISFDVKGIKIGYFNPAPKIDKIKVNPAKNATTVLWSDGTATVVKRSEDDPDDLYFAVASAMAIKFYGSNSQFKKVINDKTEYYEPKKKA